MDQREGGGGGGSWRKMSGVKQEAESEERGRMGGWVVGWRACSNGWLSSMKVTVVLSWAKAGAAC